MPLTFNPLSEIEAVKAATPDLWRGWHSAEITEASDAESKRNNRMIALRLTVSNGAKQREFRDWFTAAERSAAKIRHCCEAISKLAAYQSGVIAAEDFPGHAVQVKLEIEKGRAGYPARSVIVDYRAATDEVVNRRAAE